MRPVLRSPRRVLIDTAGKWRELVVATRWGRGKSVSELAERWTTTDLPEVEALLETRPSTGGFSPGEGLVGDREIDLLLEGQAQGGRTLIGVLPIASEPLGPSVDQELSRSFRDDRLRGGQPPLYNMARRVFNLDVSVVGELRYRLLEVSSALLREAEARGCAQAVLIIHEFRSPLTAPQVLADQIADVEAYMRKLAHRGVATAPGALISSLPNATKVALFIGRVVVER